VDRDNLEPKLLWNGARVKIFPEPDQRQ